MCVVRDETLRMFNKRASLKAKYRILSCSIAETFRVKQLMLQTRDASSTPAAVFFFFFFFFCLLDLLDLVHVFLMNRNSSLPENCIETP